MYKKKAEVLHPYYVILSRDTRFDDDRRPAPDYIRLMDADEAISSNWVTETGERVWVVPAKDENHYITFVWGFPETTAVLDGKKILVSQHIFDANVSYRMRRYRNFSMPRELWAMHGLRVSSELKPNEVEIHIGFFEKN